MRKLTAKKFKSKWKNCQECDYCETRNRIVLGSGKVPCDILFIGEAPGTAENMFGRPFVGPAGNLLDHLIKEAGLNKFKLAKTNLVSCIPPQLLETHKVDDYRPTKQAIKACQERLQDFIDLANPEAFVMVGSLAAKFAGPMLDDEQLEMTIDILHPAAILRADISQKDLQIKLATIKLKTLGERL